MKSKALFIYLILSSTGFAKDYALNLIGPGNERSNCRPAFGSDTPPSQQAEELHEFAPAGLMKSLSLKKRGYEVTTLFGEDDSMEKKCGREVFKKEVEAFDHFLKDDFQSVTKNNIDSFFEDLTPKLEPGDNVEILINSHGYNHCLDSVSLEPNGSDCFHEFTILDSNGDEIKLSSVEIAQKVAQLESTGANVNLIVDSCFADASHRAFSQLSNTCVFSLSSQESFGRGCFNSDPDIDRNLPFDQQVEFALDYTSTGSVLAWQYMRHSYEDVKEHPLFQEFKCDERLKNHVEENDIHGDSIWDVFWNARRHDVALHDPRITGVLDLSYFETENFAKILGTTRTEFLCHRNIENGLNEILGLVSDVSQAILAPLIQELLSAVQSYNLDLLDQERLKDQLRPISAKLQLWSDYEEYRIYLSDPEGKKPNPNWERPGYFDQIEAVTPDQIEEMERQSREILEAIQSLQSGTLSLSRKVVAKERQVLEAVRESLLEPSVEEGAPCRRPSFN